MSNQFSQLGSQQQSFGLINPAYLTRTNVLRLAALACLGYFAYAAFGVAPKMASKAGAPIGDVVQSLIPLVGAVLSWVFSRKFAVKPELVTAVTAVIENPKDPIADLRMLLVLVGYLQDQWPEAPEAVKLFEEGAKKIGEAVVADMTKTLPAVQP